MTPEKRKARNRRLPPTTAPQPSDYDSDLPAISPPSNPFPPSTPRTNQQLNLSVIRRHLPTTVSILSIAPYAVIYTFSPAISQWEKSGIEGTLFTCVQTPDPSTGGERYSVVVLNRKGLNDFICPLEGEVDFEAGYIILRSKDEAGVDCVWGIWIFEEEEGSTRGMREENARIIRECAARVGQREDWGNGARRNEEDEQGTGGW
ncbi:MAG: hypothetical protein LQ343_000137 [Gyalolechia ehrenbergii]|nr:MAG: hypothetical protein LQ343_000137 [Gyalolechia ehrenbergii]